jgi:nicotinamidase-related amidase
MESQLSKIDSKNLVVLLIDMQDFYIDSEEKKGLIPNQISVLEVCRGKDIPVIVVEYDGCGETTSSLLEKIKEIPSPNVYKITKSSDNAFNRSELHDLLIKLEAETLLLMGINACACVFLTASNAVQLGYKIITSEGLIAGFCLSCRKGDESGRYEWYKKNGHFSKDYNHILQVIG